MRSLLFSLSLVVLFSMTGPAYAPPVLKGTYTVSWSSAFYSPFPVSPFDTAGQMTVSKNGSTSWIGGGVPGMGTVSVQVQVLNGQMTVLVCPVHTSATYTADVTGWSGSSPLVCTLALTNPTGAGMPPTITVN